MNKLCIILNLAPHYRKAIYQAIDKEFECDWYVGDKVEDIKPMSYDQLKRCVVLKNRSVSDSWYIQKGMLKLLFKKQYSRFLITGDIRNISLWVFLLLSKLFPSKKVYTWTHGNNGKGGAISQSIKRVFSMLADGSFVYGDYARNYMISKGYNPNKLFVIHNSLDYDTQIEHREGLSSTNIYANHFKNNDYNIVFIGRLTSVKCLDLIIESIKMLSHRDVNCNLTFIGDGSDRSNLERLTAKYNLQDRVWFYGACYDERINAELIYNADLCVSPGNVGLTAMHSLVYGTPVATHNNYTLQMPEVEAIKEGLTGTYFKYSDLESMVETIERWFEHYGNRRNDIRKNCMNEIDESWTPKYQIAVLKNHIDM